MPGPNELIGTVLAALLGVSSPAVLAAPSATPDCRPSTGSSSSNTSWEQDAVALASMLAGQKGTETEGLLQELIRAGFGAPEANTAGGAAQAGGGADGADGAASVEPASARTA